MTLFTLFGLVEPRKNLTFWCVVSACRSKMKHQGGWDVGMRVPTLRGDLPSNDKNCYAFMYACAVGKSMLDSSIFAKVFCYNLECQPGNLRGFQDSLDTQYECVTFGDLRPQPITLVGHTRGLVLETRRTVVPHSFKYRRQQIAAMRRARLVAYHLHVLAHEQIFDFQEDVSSESSDLDPKSSESEQFFDCQEEGSTGIDVQPTDSYDSYLEVRGMATEIIRVFHQQAEHFESLRAQLHLLACDNLSEIKDVLSQTASGSSGDRMAKWEPLDPNQGCEDMRVVLNLPDKVVEIIEAAVRAWKDEHREFPSQQLTKVLQMLGCYFTKHNFDQFKLEESVKEDLQYYFRIPGALLIDNDYIYYYI